MTRDVALAGGVPEDSVAIALGAIYLIGGLVPLAAVPASVAMRVTMETTDVIANRYVDDRTGSMSRTTVLSAAALVYGVVQVLAASPSGAIGDAVRPGIAIAAMSVFPIVTVVAINGLLATPTSSDAVDDAAPADPVPTD
ncbi:hypothetical protein BRD17_08045 [Halobacteriales archaeon SW_7_68_16]|nr:MAG: hypothetical protein BRD17_08045 [Halobacteriales archaeon SW_7_68_16]